MLRFLRWLSISLVLLLVFLAAALFAMRFAIHGREVRVPRLTNLTPAEAERAANADGLITFVDSRYYSSEVPKGRIVFQMPPANANVRRGWKIQLAESLGPQHAAVPDLVGQSEHAAAINLHRHGLEIGNVATRTSAAISACNCNCAEPFRGCKRSCFTPDCAGDFRRK